jgi:hypothetical protein
MPKGRSRRPRDHRAVGRTTTVFKSLFQSSFLDMGQAEGKRKGEKKLCTILSEDCRTSHF